MEKSWYDDQTVKHMARKMKTIIRKDACEKVLSPASSANDALRLLEATLDMKDGVVAALEARECLLLSMQNYDEPDIEAFRVMNDLFVQRAKKNSIVFAEIYAEMLEQLLGARLDLAWSYCNLLKIIKTAIPDAIRRCIQDGNLQISDTIVEEKIGEVENNYRRVREQERQVKSKDVKFI